MTAASAASLTELLACLLPAGTSATQTRKLVRDAVRRARNEGLPVTAPVLVSLLTEDCARQRRGITSRR